MRQIIADKKSVRYTFLDVESGSLGLNEATNLPWQLSLITVVNNKIQQEHDFLLKWPAGQFEISLEAAEKTRFDPNKVQKEGVDPLKVVKVLQKEFDAADYMVGHNILGFDCHVIQSLCFKLGVPPINIARKPLDTLAIAKGIRLENFPKTEKDLIPWQYRMYHTRKKGLNKLRLEDLGREYGIEFQADKLHDSLFDLRLNVEIFKFQQKSFSYTG